MCRGKKIGSKIRRIRWQNGMPKPKIYRNRRQNHLIRIHDLQDLTTKQKFRIQYPQDPTGKTSQDPGSPGSHDDTKFKTQDPQDPRSPGSHHRTNFKDPTYAGSHNKMNVQPTRSTRSRNKMPRDHTQDLTKKWNAGWKFHENSA